jgi:hypothetical protein
MRIGSLFRLMAAGALLWATARLFLSPAAQSSETHAAIDPDDPAADRAHGAGAVRSAGPAAMRNGHGLDWDKVDQAVDESFPASDPPSR